MKLKIVLAVGGGGGGGAEGPLDPPMAIVDNTF